jgi:UDP:flavonoid glycosyltransferase YjiC (YdhE family)
MYSIARAINAGHKVRILSNRNHEDLVKYNGIEFWSLEVNTEDMVRSEKMRAAIESGSSIRSLSQMGNELKAHAALLAKRGLECCQEADLVLGGISGAFPGHSIADKLKIPFMQAYNVPFTPTREFPGLLFTSFPAGNRLSHHLTRQMVWQAYRPTDKVIREEVLGLPKNPIFGPFKSESFNRFPIVYGFSPSVIPKPADWGDHIHVTGYWFLDSEDDIKPSHELVDFLEAGSRPMYIGFGSMGNRKPDLTTKLVLDALDVTDQRAVLRARD